MILQIYCYRDIQVGAFTGKPLYALEEPKIEQVVISRTVALMKKEDVVKARVMDLELYHLGTFDDETGVIRSTPNFLIRLADYVNKDVRREILEDEQSIQSKSSEESC